MADNSNIQLPDLENITILSSMRVRVNGLSDREVELIRFIGENGYTSSIADTIFKGNKRFSKGGQALTGDARGIGYDKSATGLGISKSTITSLAKALEEKKYALRLNANNSVQIKNERTKELVLTQKGTNLYQRIEAARINNQSKQYST